MTAPNITRETTAEDIAAILDNAGQLLESGYPLNPVVVRAIRRFNCSCARFCRMVGWDHEDFALGRPVELAIQVDLDAPDPERA